MSNLLCFDTEEDALIEELTICVKLGINPFVEDASGKLVISPLLRWSPPWQEDGEWVICGADDEQSD